MTAIDLIREFQQLTRQEQATVVEFVDEFRRQNQLAPEELGELARQMVEADDPTTKEKLKEEIINGFYGR